MNTTFTGSMFGSKQEMQISNGFAALVKTLVRSGPSSYDQGCINNTSIRSGSRFPSVSRYIKLETSVLQTLPVLDIH